MFLGVQTIVVLAVFAVVAMASRQIGLLLQRARLPLITGFLLTGIVAGPFLLGLISESTVRQLRFVDEVSLAFIAIAAGAELHLRELRKRLRSVAWVTLVQGLAIFALVAVTILVVAEQIPFLQHLGLGGRVAVALLTASVLVARSPSSAIAVVKELRARGPFTKLALGVTMIMDVAVIVLFAVNSSIADAVMTGAGFAPGTVLLVMGEIATSVLLGVAGGALLGWLLARRLSDLLQMGLLLAIGYGIFRWSAFVRSWTHAETAFEVLLEPLLICMVAGFWAANFSTHRLDLERLVHQLGPPVYIAFFTLVGASLEMSALLALWPLTVIFFIVRLVGLIVGNLVGGTLAGDPARLNRVGWMAYVTQAGIGVGLAKEIAVEFPVWGETLSTLLMAVIVVNQIVGPPLFKRVLRYLGEADISGEPKRRHTALVFGLDYQAVALARQLAHYGWQVRIATRQEVPESQEAAAEVEFVRLEDHTLESLRAAGTEGVECIVALTRDEESYEICRLAYENFGTPQMVVRLNEHENLERFQALGATVLDPSTAIVSLLDHFVRSPSSTALLLGQDGSQAIEEFELSDPGLHGLRLRDLDLPLDTLVVAVDRRGEKLVCHGYTRIELGDRISVVGSRESLEEVALRFEAAG